MDEAVDRALARVRALKGFERLVVVALEPESVLFERSHDGSSVDASLVALVLERTHRLLDLTEGEPLEDIHVSTPAGHVLVRLVASPATLVVVLLLEREHANVAMARFAIESFSRSLAGHGG